jgi:invasion protein IalB
MLGLPHGAAAISETHGDWTVARRTAEGTVRCAMTQTQVGGENRQSILAVELVAAERRDVTSGLLVLPFGLRLGAGVGLTIDEPQLRRNASSRPA